MGRKKKRDRAYVSKIWGKKEKGMKKKFTDKSLPPWGGVQKKRN